MYEQPVDLDHAATHGQSRSVAVFVLCVFPYARPLEVCVMFAKAPNARNDCKTA